MPEIDEHTLALLRGSHALLEEVWNDPKHGQNLKRAVKEKRPQVSIPEIDVPDQVLAPVHAELNEYKATLAKVNERLESYERERSDEKLEGTFRTKLKDARSKFNLTEDGEKGVLQLMQERQIADPEAAAALYVANLPKPKPSSLRDSSAYGASSYANPGLRGGESEHDALRHTDPDAFFFREAMAVMDEFAEQA
jgi:hypothetical protein